MEIKKMFCYPDEAEVEKLSVDANISKLEASIFINRGINTPKEVEVFMDKNPSSLKDYAEKKYSYP